MNLLLFHIGLPKTGSTSLQVFLSNNREELKKYGWSYPDFSIAVESAQSAVNNGLYLRFPSFENKRDALWKIIMKELKDYNVMISDEGFSDEDIALLLSCAKKVHDNVKVIVYLRRQDQYMASLYNQMIKVAYVNVSIQKFIEDMSQWSQNYLNKLEKISRFIGEENIIVRIYEKQQFAGTRKDIISDFMYTILEGIEPEWDELLIPDRENSALKGNYLEIKKLFNSIETDQDRRWPIGYLEPILEMSSKFGSLYENSATEGYLTKQERINIINSNQENNAIIARKYLHREDGILFYDTNVDFPVYEEKATSFEADMIRMYSALFHKMQLKIELLPLVTAVKMFKGERDLVFYGAGNRGKQLLDYPLIPRYLIDNGPDKRGRTERTIKIISASEMKDWENCFVVVTPYHCADIEQELQTYGLTKGNGYLLMNDYL